MKVLFRLRYSDIFRNIIQSCQLFCPSVIKFNEDLKRLSRQKNVSLGRSEAILAHIRSFPCEIAVLVLTYRCIAHRKSDNQLSCSTCAYNRKSLQKKKPYSLAQITLVCNIQRSSARFHMHHLHDHVPHVHTLMQTAPC